MTNKTNSNNPVFGKEMKTRVGRGASSAFGAILGAFGGTSTAEAFAAKPEEVIVDTPVADEVVDTPVHRPTPKPISEPTHVSQTESSTPVSPETPEPPAPPTTTVEVIDYQTIVTEDGLADIATVSVNDETFIVADMDQNGWADHLLNDQNQNGTFEEDEVVLLEDQEMAMAPLREAYEQGRVIVFHEEGSEPDYINDSNVDNYFMA